MFQVEKDPLHLVRLEPQIIHWVNVLTTYSSFCCHVYWKKKYHNLDRPVCIVTWTFYRGLDFIFIFLFHCLIFSDLTIMVVNCNHSWWHWPIIITWITICRCSPMFDISVLSVINPLNAKLNPICYLLALLGAHHILHVSRIRVKFLWTLIRKQVFLWFIMILVEFEISSCFYIFCRMTKFIWANRFLCPVWF